MGRKKFTSRAEMEAAKAAAASKKARHKVERLQQL